MEMSEQRMFKCEEFVRRLLRQAFELAEEFKNIRIFYLLASQELLDYMLRMQGNSSGSLEVSDDQRRSVRAWIIRAQGEMYVFSEDEEEFVALNEKLTREIIEKGLAPARKGVRYGSTHQRIKPRPNPFRVLQKELSIPLHDLERINAPVLTNY